LLELTELKDNNMVRAEAKRQYESSCDLIDYVETACRNSSAGNRTIISKYDYTNDVLGRRTGIAYTGLAFYNPPLTQTLTYNDRNELTESTRSDSSLLRRTYTYDPIGNRTESRDRTAPSELVTAYQRNELNQYPRADTTGPATNLGQGYRYDDDGDMLEAYVAADMDCNATINTFDVDAFTLALTNLPQYYVQYPTCNHLNGDMNGDGVLDTFDIDLFTEYLTGHSGATGLRQVYTWDAENRLITAGPADDMTLINGTKRAECAYDYMGRRIEKKVYTWTTMPPPGHWALTEHRRFVWAGTGMGGVGVSPAGGWLMLMELDALNHSAVVRKYTWGLDLAGQSGGQTSGLPGLEGAGGIGGLLAVCAPGAVSGG
jgi:hypothetical protein